MKLLSKPIVILFVVFIILKFLWLVTGTVIPVYYQNLGYLSLFHYLQDQNSNLKFDLFTTPPNQLEKYFNLALKYDPAAEGALLGRGIARFHSEDIELAVSDLEHVVNSRKQPGLAYFWLGLAYQAVDDNEQAIHAWRKAGAANYFFMLGETTYRLGLFHEAQRNYEIVIKIDPDFDPAPYFKLGIIQWRSQAGIKAFQNAWRLGPNTAMGYSALGFSALFQGELERSRDYFLKAWSLDPTPSWPYEGLADIAEAVGVETIEDYITVIGREPFENVCNWLSSRWDSRGDVDRAEYWAQCGNESEEK